MANLIIRLFGREVERINLQEKHEWRAGRSDSCDIVLQKEPGISREHFIIRESGDGTYSVEVLSKYGKVIVEGDEITIAQLEPGSRFLVTPYEFQIEEEISQEMSEQAASGNARNLPAMRQTNFPSAGAEDEEDFFGNDEKTSIGQLVHSPHIKIIDESGTIQQILRLEGNFWLAGRDPANAIHIADNRVSRLQFEITKQDDSFYIRDLESVNGTLINGNLIAPGEPTPLISGDTISVLNNHLIFELRDASFSDKIGNLPSVAHHGSGGYLPSDANNYYQNGMAPYTGAQMPESYEAPHVPQPWEKVLGTDRKTQIIRGGLIAVLLFGGLYTMIGSGPPPVQQQVEEDPLAKLTPEQRSLVKHTYELAKSLLMQGKYELAAAEIAKVHELIPEYLDSRDIEDTTTRAFELKRQKELIERQAREAKEMEEKIQATVSQCRTKIHDSVTSEEMLICLAPAMELNPEHPDILAIQARVEEIIEQQRLDEVARLARLDLIEKGKNLYYRAKKLDDKEEWLDAIAAYKRYLNSGLPDPVGNKGRSERRIASIRSGIDKQVESVIQQSEAFYKERNLKDAALILNKAIKIDPDNDKIKADQKKIISELEKEMRILYQESILEESLGKITTARDRWQTIMTKDVPEGEYFKKASIKMKRYGSF